MLPDICVVGGDIYINILYTNHFGAMVDFEGA
jgi:hypothetical protein